jgi:hypothetical protein
VVQAPVRPAALTRFLSARDVDEALAAARKLSYRDADVEASIRHLLAHEWKQQPQAVYNVLQHSYMLPGDIRFATLQRGLQEKDETQLRLAAAVGVQYTGRALLDGAPVAEHSFRTLLLQYAAESEEDDFLAARAFLAIKDYLRHPRDTRFVLALLGDKIVWRNALTWALTQLSTAERPLTSQRLIALIEEAKAVDSGAVAAPGPFAPDSVAWNPQWSERLQAVDLEVVRAKAGAALDEHWARMAKSKESASKSNRKAKLLQYQEIDIPSYAPLQQGFTDANGQTHLAAAPAAGGSARAKRPQEPFAHVPVARFQPDVVLVGVDGKERAEEQD